MLAAVTSSQPWCHDASAVSTIKVASAEADRVASSCFTEPAI
jgi:hypothetical protein